MKRIKYLFAAIIGVMLFTGCAIKLDVNMEISKEGKVNFGLIQAFDRELLTNMMNMGGSETTYTDDELKQFLQQSLEESEEGESSDLDIYKQKGFTATEYVDDKFLGYKFSAIIDNIDKVSASEENVFNFSDMSELTGSIQEQKLFKKDGNQYIAHFVFDPASSSALDTEDSESDGTDDSTDDQMEQYLNMIEQIYTFTLTLPKTPISHNATTVSEDGKTLTWNLSKDAKTDINFTFVLEEAKTPVVATDNDSSLGLYIAIGAGVLALIVIIIVLITSKKEPSNQNNNQVYAPLQENNSMLNNNFSNNANMGPVVMPVDSNPNNAVMGTTELPMTPNNNSAMMAPNNFNPTPINDMPTNYFCPNCGAKNIENNNFCTNCGNRLK